MAARYGTERVSFFSGGTRCAGWLTLPDGPGPRYIAATAPLGLARHYDGDHFQIYHPPLLQNLLDDQTDFVKEHLGVRVG